MPLLATTMMPGAYWPGQQKTTTVYVVRYTICFLYLACINY